MQEAATDPAGSPATAWVFVNHRGGCAGWAVYLDNALSTNFGADRVFRASRSIQPGDDFVDRILATVAASKVLVALIGPDWVSATDQTGGRALDNDRDWVRREIQYAIAHGIPVLPLLVDNAAPLRSTDVPDPLADLARRQYLRMSHRTAQADTERVCAELVRLVPELRSAKQPSRRRRWLPVALLSTVVATLLSVATSFAVTDGRTWRGSDGTVTAQSSTPEPSPSADPWVAVRPAEGTATGTINIRGAGYPSARSVALSISNNGDWLPLGRAHTNAFGEFVASVDLRSLTDVAARLTAGTHVVATDVDGDRRLHATTRYTVVNG
jgi:hypothetical protein